MNENKSLPAYFAEWWDARRVNAHDHRSTNRWLPTPGNILFTLLIAGLLVFTQQTWANNGPESVNVPGPSATTVNYQGRLAAPDGTPKNGTFGMSFAIYDAASGGNVVWGAESHTAVPVTDGLFNVGLGSQTSGGIPTTVWNGDRYLQITVGGETLSPRELIRSVPVAGMALTVPNGVIGTSQLTENSVTNTRSIVVGPNASDVTTSSRIFQNIPGYEIVMQTYGGPVLLSFQANARGELAVPGSSILFDFAIDGVRVGQSDKGINRIISYSVTENASMIWLAHPPAGIHTFTVQWRVDDGGGAEAVINQGSFASQFTATELKR